MRVSGGGWRFGETSWSTQNYGLDGGLRALSFSSEDNLGELQHMSMCACAGCLTKLADHYSPEYAVAPPTQHIVEPPDIAGSTATTATLAIGGSETGALQIFGDDDWFAVQLVAGQSYVFTLTGSGASPLQDPYLEIRNALGILIGLDDDGGAGTNALLRWTATETGTYYINARAWEEDGPYPGYTGVGSYTITAAIGPPQNPLDAINLGFAAPSHIDVYFSTNTQTQSFGPPGNQTSVTSLRSWTPAEIAQAMAALQVYATYTNLTFAQTSTQSNAEWVLTLADLDDGTLGWFATYNGVGYGAFAPDGTGWQTAPGGGLNQGGLGWVTLIHEFGHGLGLAHPHDNGGVSEVMQGVTAPFNSLGTFGLNQGVYTTMTYNDGWVSQFGGGQTGYGSQGTPMALDIGLLQQRYGANATTNSGDTTYILPTANQAGTFFSTIWDTGGNDTIVQNGSAAATIDLRAATLLNQIGGGGWISSVSGIRGGFTIANGVLIENAIGGSGADTLIGNDFANRLVGNGGNDTLIGGRGIDTAGYNLTSSLATWHRNPDGTWTVTAGAAGADTLTSVEFLDFTDRDVFLDRAYSTFSGDGTSDVFMRHSSGALGVWFVGGSGVTGAAGLGVVAVSWAIEGVGDFNGDGRDDIFMRNDNGNLGVWFMNGASASGAAGLGNIDLSWDIAGLGDLNGDGFDDILMWNTNGSLGVWFMNNGAVSGAAGLGNISHASFTLEGLGDFNGDGRDDILWRNSAGDAGIWFMNGGAATGASIGNIPTNWAIEGIGDFNGDGRDDILMRDAAGNLGAWFMNGASATGVGLGNVDHTFSVAAVGDYNGDGRDDILWWNDNGSLGAWFMNGAAASAIGYGSVSHDWIINPGG